MSLIFISYRREDSAGYAGRLHESLERRLGEGEVFRDVDALEPGQDFVDAIAARLRDCSVCLVLIGREWLDATDTSRRLRLEQENDYVRLEIATALAQPDVIVVPVLVEGMSMPTAEEFPESIRALSRRHATSLRDETWDADVDRLVRALRKATGDRRDFRHITAPSDHPPAARARLPEAASMLKWAMLAATVLAVILLARSFRAPDREPRTDGSDVLVHAPAYAIAIPRLAEIAHGSLIYTLLSGEVIPHGNERTVRLRFRFSNEDSAAANFWDNSFRLAVQGQVLSPTSGLNEVVSGHSLQQGVVSFEVPADATKVVLRVLHRDETAELPLSLASTGVPSQVDSTDTGDALSRATVVVLVRDAKPLVSGRTISYTLAAMTLRRFVNKLRVLVGLRVTNHGPHAWYFGTDAIRLMVDDQATAPFHGPTEVVAPDATVSANFAFDLAPSVRHFILRVMGESAADMPFDLP